jgi:predicted nucleic-acid-binding Zn-ribbon protein
MATPKCPSCSNTSFELNEISINKAAWRTYGVCCSQCGAVVGVQEFFNIGILVKKLAKGLKINLDSVTL